MALSSIFGGKKHSLKIKTYTIDQTKVLGQGAVGVVFKGIDAKKKVIAAKCINANAYPRVLTQDLDRLMQLDHHNVMKILDVERKMDAKRNENNIWMIMPLCELGDLNNFCRIYDAPDSERLSIMKQVAEGIEYLHGKDIVHRDIKPGNILVASVNPVHVQLADFDVTKCLDPEVETSLMTSNVGTLAFKAPEFFQRTSPGKIEYHRNVDIYAAGLTFLAIMQAEKGKKMLIPRIETPLHDSEYYTDSIGRLIAERIKYEVDELNIVKIEGVWIYGKHLISLMCRVNPADRMPAAEVTEYLRLSDVEDVPVLPYEEVGIYIITDTAQI